MTITKSIRIITIKQNNKYILILSKITVNKDTSKTETIIYTKIII